jgi:hypothetical protein
MRTSSAELLARQGVRYAVIDAMAAAVHGVIRARLDADAIAALKIREAQVLRQSLVEKGYEAVLRQVRLAETTLEIVGREDFVAMKASAGGPVDLADARAVIDLDRDSLDLELSRRLAQRFGRDAARTVEHLIGGVY